MSETTKIQWCDSTWNWVMGCTKVSPGCKFCFAENSPPARLGGIKWGDQGERKISSDATFNAPLKWNKKPWVCDGCATATGSPITASTPGEDIFAEYLPKREPRLACPECGHPVHRRRVFSLSLGDWLDPKIPVPALARALDIIRRCEHLDCLLCTKRPELFDARMLEVWHCEANVGQHVREFVHRWRHGRAPHNVWVIASVEDQERTTRISDLLKIPAVVHGLSCEPLLGPLSLGLQEYQGPQPANAGHIDWVIVGGESGRNARPCNVEWIRSIKDQCKAAGVACLVKQIGSNPIANITTVLPHHPKGGDPSEWPTDLQIQQFPTI